MRPRGKRWTHRLRNGLAYCSAGRTRGDSADRPVAACLGRALRSGACLLSQARSAAGLEFRRVALRSRTSIIPLVRRHKPTHTHSARPPTDRFRFRCLAREREPDSRHRDRAGESSALRGMNARDSARSEPRWHCLAVAWNVSRFPHPVDNHLAGETSCRLRRLE